MKKANTLEQGLEIIFTKFTGEKSKPQTETELLNLIEENIYEELRLMGYIRHGGALIPDKNGIEKATITWALTESGEEEYRYKKSRFKYSKEDRELIDFYSKY